MESETTPYGQSFGGLDVARESVDQSIARILQDSTSIAPRIHSSLTRLS
jgi:hypothetical protein